MSQTFNLQLSTDSTGESNNKAKGYYNKQQVIAMRKNADKSNLIFETRIEQQASKERPTLHSSRGIWLWNDRFTLTVSMNSQHFWTFDLFDLFNNESRSIQFHKSNKNATCICFLPLSNEIALFAEYFGVQCQLSLVKLDLPTSSFKTIKRFETQHYSLFVIVDKSDPSKFVMRYTENGLWSYQACKLVGQEIQFDGAYQSADYFLHYCNDKLIKYYFNQRSNKFTINVYNCKTQILECSSEIEPLDESVYYDHEGCEWFNDRLYATIHFCSTGDFGIAWADLKSKRWTVMNFAYNALQLNLHFLNNSLVIHSRKAQTKDGVFKSVVKFHRIPMSCALPLQELAWIATVRLMEMQESKNGATKNHDQYIAASKYLPLTSKLRSPWFEDTEEN